jgi:hydroxymethylpyrimidine/phosphomethylpyrimidine kinase
MKKRIACAMTIAGSDSGGGAGVQADLKTFSSLGVFGACAITAVTAQNTRGVYEIFSISPETVKKQIETVLEDIPVKAVKTGMLFSKEIISVVADAITRYNLKTVVDPVFQAGSGDPLIGEEDKKALIELLIPKALLLTPNKFEAEIIADMKIEKLEDMEKAAELIAKKNGNAGVIIKGGHVENLKAVTDLFYYKGEIKTYTKPRIVANLHGGGCVFSAAITAYLAQDYSLTDAVTLAEQYVQDAIAFSLQVGEGRKPVNPMASLLNEAEKFKVLENVATAAKMVEENSMIHPYIAEVGTQIGMATSYASTKWHVAAIQGRIVKMDEKAKAVGCAKFGASDHVARIILAIMKHDQSKKAAMNIHYDKGLVEMFQKLGYTVSSFDRKLEPAEVKAVEGGTLEWGVNEAIKKVGVVPDIIFDGGEVGKEPMIRVIGTSATSVVEKTIGVIQKLKK